MCDSLIGYVYISLQHQNITALFFPFMKNMFSFHFFLFFFISQQPWTMCTCKHTNECDSRLRSAVVEVECFCLFKCLRLADTARPKYSRLDSGLYRAAPLRPLHFIVWLPSLLLSTLPLLFSSCHGSLLYGSQRELFTVSSGL